MTKRPRGRPKVRPETQAMHLLLARDLYERLKQWSTDTDIPMNTLVERAVKTALQQKGA